WAAPLTSDRVAGDDRMLRAARLLLANGQLDRVAALLPAIGDCDPGPVRDLVLGCYAYETGDAETAQRLLSAAAVHPDADASVRAAAHVRLSSIYLLQREPRMQAESAVAALSLENPNDDISRSALGSLASAESALKGAPAGLAVLARRLPEE